MKTKKDLHWRKKRTERVQFGPWVQNNQKITKIGPTNDQHWIKKQTERVQFGPWLQKDQHLTKIEPNLDQQTN